MVEPSRPDKVLPGVLQTAVSFRLRLRGLMFRKAWPEKWNGLYFPECSAIHTFFTWVEFELVFLDDSHRVTRLEAGPRPWRFYNGPQGTIDALELPMGTIQLLNLKVGDPMRWVVLKMVE